MRELLHLESLLLFPGAKFHLLFFLNLLELDLGSLESYCEDGDQDLHQAHMEYKNLQECDDNTYSPIEHCFEG